MRGILWGEETKLYRFDDLRIGARLGLGLGMILAFMVGVVALGIFSMGHISEKMADVVNYNNKRIWYAHMLIDSVHHEERAVLTSMVTKDDQLRVFEGVKILTARAACREALESLELLTDSQRGREILERLRLALDTNGKLSDRLLGLVDSGKSRQASTLYSAEARPYVLSLHQLCSELITVQESENQQRYGEALSTYRTTRAAFLLLSGLAIAAAILAASILSRGISRPLQEGVRMANQLAEGKLPARTEVRRKDETGQLLAAMEHMVEKLSQMRELEKQLAESQKLETLGRLSGGIAHDFNNILNIILGNAQLIRMNPNTDPRTADRCVSIESAVDKAAGFIRQLLAFSKGQSLELRSMNLNDTVLDFEKMMKRMVGEHIEIRIETDPGLPAVRADRSGVNQVLLNLIVNAKEAMPGGGILTIETSGMDVDEALCLAHPGATAGRYAVVSVIDTGTGLSEEVRAKIFEPFFTTKETGTGLGLSVVYGIVRQHGGFVAVRSQPACGTSFDVFLPAHSSEREKATVLDGAIPLKQGSEKILYVEDEADVRVTVSEFLGLMGYRVLTASNGEEAVKIFEHHGNEIDLVLMDVVMPKMGGIEALKGMRAMKSDTKAILLTGYGLDRGNGASALLQGVEILQKPCSMDNLSGKIRAVLDRRI